MNTFANKGWQNIVKGRLIPNSELRSPKSERNLEPKKRIGGQAARRMAEVRASHGGVVSSDRIAVVFIYLSPIEFQVKELAPV